MKRASIILIFPLLYCCTSNKMNYPITKKVNVVDTFYNTSVEDPYRWLENDTTAETASWVKAQNQVTFDYLETLPNRKEIKARLTELWDYPKTGTPFNISDRWFIFKNNGLQNQNVLYTMDSLEGEPYIWLDPNTLSKDGTVAFSGMDVSPDGKYLVYKIARSGSDWNEIFIKEISSGKMLEDHIEWAKFSEVACFEDGFFYSAYDKPEPGNELSETNSGQKIYFHKYGTKQSNDELIFSNPSMPSRMYGANLEEKREYLIITETESTSGNGLYIKNLKKPNSKIIKLADGFEFDYQAVDIVDNKILVVTNDSAPKLRLIAIDPEKPARENWEEIIPEKENTLLSVSYCGGKIITEYMADATSKLEIYTSQGEYKGNIDLPGICSVTGFSGKPNSNIAFYSYSSFNTPG